VYVVLIGIPLCFGCVLAGLMLIAVGALLCGTIIMIPIGLPMIAAGLTSIALGTKYLTLPNRRRA
jgi:hypothetical protein